MSNSLMELECFNRLNKNKSFELYKDLSDFSNISFFNKNQFIENFHFLCKKCNKIPIIQFIQKNKVKYICKCEQSPRELFIKDVFDLLYFKENEIEEKEKLKCRIHKDEKYIFYCQKCQKNLCPKCAVNV